MLNTRRRRKADGQFNAIKVAGLRTVRQPQLHDHQQTTITILFKLTDHQFIQAGRSAPVNAPLAVALTKLPQVMKFIIKTAGPRPVMQHHFCSKLRIPPPARRQSTDTRMHDQFPICGRNESTFDQSDRKPCRNFERTEEIPSTTVELQFVARRTTASWPDTRKENGRFECLGLGPRVTQLRLLPEPVPYNHQPAGKPELAVV